MCKIACLFAICLLIASRLHAQQPTQTPPSPQQLAENRQRLSAYERQRTALRTQARRAFDEEMAAAEAGDCKDAVSTVDVNRCFGEAADRASQHLSTLRSATRALLLLQYPFEIPSVVPGPEGLAQTPAQAAAEFNALESTWKSYADRASSAAFDQFDGGTGAPGAELQTRLRLVREHMREIAEIYNLRLYK